MKGKHFLVALVIAGIIIGYIGYTLFAPSEPVPTPTPTPTPTPPEIKEIRWEPDRVLNDKVYDGEVSFVAESKDSLILEANLVFKPVNYSHLPRGISRRKWGEAFPEESVRSYELTPLDGAFDEKREEFLVDVTDIKGGREYDIEIIVKDKTGNIVTASLTTLYIREFENIAPLDGISIGAYYYPWYSSDRHWQEGYRERPLLGLYDSRDPLVISKHIDWATGHGIDAFIISWWGPDSWEDKTIKDYFLKSPLIDDVKFGILYESVGRLRVTKTPENDICINLDDPVNRRILLHDFSYLTQTYFDHPQFLSVDGGRAVELYLARIFTGDVEEVVTSLRDQTHDMGYKLYLIGDLVYWQDRPSSERKNIKLYDAITPYNMHTSDQEILDDFENNVAKKYSEWLYEAKDLEVDLITSPLPGFDDTAVRTGNIPLPKSTERFKKQMEIAIRHAYSHIPDNLKMIVITTFNEWHEDTQIEPSAKDGYKYLQIIKESLT